MSVLKIKDGNQWVQIPTVGIGLTMDAKNALLNFFRHVIFDDGQGRTYYNALYDALGGCTAISLDKNTILLGYAGETEQITATTSPIDGAVTWASSDTAVVTVDNGLVTAVSGGTATITATCGTRSATCTATVQTLSSIDAVYTAPEHVYDDATLDDLRQYLVVTASWAGGATSVITNYTLSGTLTIGTCTITVSYGGCTDTFTVNVEDKPLYNWDFTTSIVDTMSGNTGELLGNLTQTSTGLDYNTDSQSIRLPNAYARGRAIEIDVTNFDIQDSTDHNVRFVMTNMVASGQSGILIWRKNTTIGWSSYQSAGGGWSSHIYGSLSDRNVFANCTIRLEVSSSGIASLYKDGVLIGDTDAVQPSDAGDLWIGSTSAASSGGNLYNVKITGVRIYE